MGGTAEYPFLGELAVRCPGHDDREQFLAGIDLILSGIQAMEQTGWVPGAAQANAGLGPPAPAGSQGRRP